mmetsp:Transcript_38827/g.120011  ORF Transcript_38827/g.120011 Transcript_38827/m.120011 type:complete len:146 (-) Transcript_38827:2039-2476(-)
MGNCNSADAASKPRRPATSAHPNPFATTSSPTIAPSGGPLARDVLPTENNLDVAAIASSRGRTKNYRHRSASDVARADTGYELPEPPLAEHLGRMERRAAIAISVHGMTADVDQFVPDPMPAATIARSVQHCREWLCESSAHQSG